MGKVKYFDEKSEKNRARVRKCRELKKTRLNHENNVRKRMYSKDDNFFDGISNNDRNECTGSNDEFYDGSKDDTGFETRLKFWATDHQISASAIGDLLKILISFGFTFLPKSSSTFMQTPCKTPIEELSNGRMWYNGVKNCLQRVLSNISRDLSLSLDFNVDGIPVFKSSNVQFWPILMSIQGIPYGSNGSR